MPNVLRLSEIRAEFTSRQSLDGGQPSDCVARPVLSLRLHENSRAIVLASLNDEPGASILFLG
jgi:hypothetical protein